MRRNSRSLFSTHRFCHLVYLNFFLFSCMFFKILCLLEYKKKLTLSKRAHTQLFLIKEENYKMNSKGIKCAKSKRMPKNNDRPRIPIYIIFLSDDALVIPLESALQISVYILLDLRSPEEAESKSICAISFVDFIFVVSNQIHFYLSRARPFNMNFVNIKTTKHGI